MLLTGDRFGASTAVLGDVDGDGVDDLAVGSPGDTDGDGLTKRGAIWILFMTTIGTVKDEQLISATSGGLPNILRPGDQFGWSVAGVGDLDLDGVPDVAVGAPFTDPAADLYEEHGAVHVLFLNSDGTVKSTVRISDGAGFFPGEFEDGDEFGTSVANIGDLDGDGIEDLIVGAPIGEGYAMIKDFGSAWILFMQRDGKPRAAVEITEDVGVDGVQNVDQLGWAVAGIGDLDRDGVRDVAIGAIGDDDGGVDQGAIYIVFLNPDGSGKSFQKISALFGGFTGIELSSLSKFGYSLGWIGDVDGDGFGELAAPQIIPDLDTCPSCIAYVVNLLDLDDGVTGLATPYGSGVNPVGSLSVSAGRPAIGTTVTLGVDNPLGTQTPGSIAFVFLAASPDALFPAGTLIPGFGMGGAGANGELLIDLASIVPPALVGTPWGGVGQPSLVSAVVPNDAALVGVHAYLQGILIDPTVSLGVRFGLTEALDARIGL